MVEMGILGVTATDEPPSLLDREANTGRVCPSCATRTKKIALEGGLDKIKCD